MTTTPPPAPYRPRRPWQVTLSVWKAMILRESLARLFASRAAWVWVLSEPAVHIVYLALIYSTIRLRVIGGIDVIAWIVLGVLAFFMFRRTAAECMNAVGDSSALYAYRQVKPIDAVLVRAALEGVLMVAVAILVFLGLAVYGVVLLPDDPLTVLMAVMGMWLVGLGFGLMASVAKELVPELGRLIRFALKPMYLLSGVIFPLSAVPPPFRGWLMLNPVAHGTEAVRQGYATYYHAVPETSLAYIYGFALVTVFLGLALHRRFALRLAAL